VKRSTTILQQVGYNEVVGVRQAGKSTACIARLFLDNLCTSLEASLFNQQWQVAAFNRRMCPGKSAIHTPNLT
jgi:hypothetical protein